MCLANRKRNQLNSINICSGNGYTAVRAAVNRVGCIPTGVSAGLAESMKSIGEVGRNPRQTDVLRMARRFLI